MQKPVMTCKLVDHAYAIAVVTSPSNMLRSYMVKVLVYILKTAISGASTFIPCAQKCTCAIPHRHF